MRKHQIRNPNVLCTAVLLYAVALFAPEAGATPDDSAGMDLYPSAQVMIAMLSVLILLFIGMLIYHRQMRMKLSAKSESLVKSQNHIRLMADHLPNVTVFELSYTDHTSLRFSYLSQGCEDLLGLSREQVLADAQLAYDHVYEEDQPLLLEAFNQSRTNLSATHFEMRVLDKNGNLKWLSISAVPHQDEGAVIWNGLIQDVTPNKEIEDALLEENRNFHNLFETIDDLMIVCDMDGRLLHSNPAVIQRLNYSANDLESMSIYELFSDAAKDDIYQVMATIQSERSTSAGMPLQVNGGGVIPVEMSVFQGFWKNKRAVFAIARDVAGRQQTEDALRESQQMLQLIMDTIPMSVFWKDKDSIYLGCNKTFIRECGLEQYEDVVGNNPYDLFPTDLAASIIDRDQDVIRNNHPLFHFTQSHTKTDGSIGWREVSKIPLRDERGRAVGVLGVWRDITEQNRAEERLKRTLEDMERFNQLMRGRERRTLELKSEINDLLKQLGRAKKYRTTTDDIE